MPVRPSTEDNVLKTYSSLGVDLKTSSGSKEAIGDCPFCGRENKFSVVVKTGLFRCLVCSEGNSKGGGNPLVFARRFLSTCFDSTKEYSKLVASRGVKETTFIRWGVAYNDLTGEWLIPTYNAKKAVVGVIRYPIGGKGYATPGLTTGMFLPDTISEKVQRIYLCEGPWDSMAVWELCDSSSTAIGISGTSSFSKSFLTSDIFKDREIVILFDNDYPKEKNGKKTPPAGYLGTRRTIGILTEEGVPPEDVSWLKWGKEGYDPRLPDGYDLRDYLKDSGEKREDRLTAFIDLLDSRISPPPKEWIKTKEKGENGGGREALPPLECEDYRTLTMAWKKAMKWTEGLDCALSVMLSSSLSTSLVGEQLWFKVISPPGSGKTTLVEGLSVAKEYTFSKDTIRGFYTGWASGEEDTSIAALARNRTLIIKDGDTLLKSPNLSQILSEGRGLYDGAGRTHYRNTVSRDYEGHRMTWILCGTSALREIDDSELGSRFLDVVIMEGIDEVFESEVSKRSGNQELDNLYLDHTNGEAEGGKSKDLSRAMRLTGGYVNYLRENDVEVISTVERDSTIVDYCSYLGQFVSRMRARPSKVQEEEYTREFSARLVKQFVRLSVVLAAVMNRSKVDEEVKERVTKVAKDTSRGVTLEITRILYEEGEGGRTKGALATLVDVPDTRMKTLLQFLKKIKVIVGFRKKVGRVKQETRYRLTKTMRDLYTIVVKGEDSNAG